MNTGLALKSFRASTALVSSASLARATPACHSARRLMLTRHYSEEAAKSESEAKKEESNGEQSPASEQEKLLQEKLKAKEAEVTDLTGRLRYLQADFLNLQRNSAREKEQTRDFAITKFASDLLETADVLALALKSVPPSALQPTSSDNSSGSSGSVPETGKTSLQYLQELHSGVEITQRQLLQTLFKYHVKPFDPTGDKFDPNMHEALYQAPIPGKEPGTVLDCQKIGYMIKDRVLRAAQVGVVQDTS